MLKIGAKNGILSYVSGKFRHIGLSHLKTTIASCSTGVGLHWMLSCISFPQTKDVFSWLKVTPLFPELVVLIGSVESEECGRCGVRKMQSVENVEHFNFNMKLTNNLIPLYSHSKSVL